MITLKPKAIQNLSHYVYYTFEMWTSATRTKSIQGFFYHPLSLVFNIASVYTFQITYVQFSCFWLETVESTVNKILLCSVFQFRWKTKPLYHWRCLTFGILSMADSDIHFTHDQMARYNRGLVSQLEIW